MKYLRKFNEEIDLFGKKKSEDSDDLRPKGFKSIERPEWSYEKPEIKTGGFDTKIDPYFIQEISDRLYGPDSEEYVKELTELNKRFKPRGGRVGSQFYEPK